MNNVVWKFNQENWSTFFNLENAVFKRKGFKFDGKIKTDGISVTIQLQTDAYQNRFQRKKEEDELVDPSVIDSSVVDSRVIDSSAIVDPVAVDSCVIDSSAIVIESSAIVDSDHIDIPYLDAKNIEEIQNNFVVIDPNKRDLLFCLGSNGKNLRYTYPRHRRYTGLRKQEQRRKKLLKDNQVTLLKLTTKFFSTSTVKNVYNQYLQEFFAHGRLVKDHYENLIYRKMRLWTYSNTQRCLDKFMQSFKQTFCKDIPNSECDIILGDWDAGSSRLRGLPPTKGRSFIKLFQKHGYNTFLFDEYHTSKMCFDCGEVCVKNLRYRKTPWWKSRSNFELIIEYEQRQKAKEERQAKSAATATPAPTSNSIVTPNMFSVLDDCDVVESAHRMDQEVRVPTGFQYENEKILMTTAGSIQSLPPNMSIEKMRGDGACLFNSVSFAISGEQTLARIYRKKALEYITKHSQDFEVDIRNMTSKSVEEYVREMTSEYAYGDAIMIIAMCLELNASITVFVETRTSIDSVTYSPRDPSGGEIDHKVKIYLTMGGENSCPHYDCIVDSVPVDVVESEPDVVIESVENPSSSQTTKPSRKRRNTTSQSDSIKKTKPSSTATIPIEPRKSSRLNPKSPSAKDKPNPKKAKPIHGLIGCKSKQCQAFLRENFREKKWTKADDLVRYYNRDVNATMNMLKCVLYMKANNGQRPLHLTRPITQQL